jgi:DNA-binding NarL/FixJ family response regulator
MRSIVVPASAARSAAVRAGSASCRVFSSTWTVCTRARDPRPGGEPALGAVLPTLHCGIPRDAAGANLRHRGRSTLPPTMEVPPLSPERPATPAPRRIRVGVVDDHPAIVAAVTGAIAGSADLELVGSGPTLADAMILADRVDVLVCDVQLDGHAEGLDILDAVQRAGRPPAILMLSGFGHPSIIRAAIERGAAGYLDKGAELTTILDAIRVVANGGTVFSASALQRSRVARRRPSDREIEVIDLVRAGSTNAEVAAALGLSEKTVESHLRRLFDRYGLLSRTELAVMAIEEGWSADHRADR